jgi:hypothetical protein
MNMRRADENTGMPMAMLSPTSVFGVEIVLDEASGVAARRLVVDLDHYLAELARINAPMAVGR